MKKVFAMLFLVLVLTVGCNVVQTECHVGVSGTNASITVQGFLAGQTCSQLVGKTWPLVKDWLQYNFYSLDKPLVQRVHCQYNISGQQFVVRDDGPLGIAIHGPILCKILEQAQR